MKELVYVSGHRNPDTDSICSAIGYAYLLKALDRYNACLLYTSHKIIEACYINFNTVVFKSIIDNTINFIIMIDDCNFIQSTPPNLKNIIQKYDKVCL